MAYILSPMIGENLEGMWFEGSPYSSETIYEIQEGKLPPVNYDLHKIKSHSLTHAEAPKHTQKTGKGIEAYFDNKKYFYGKAVLVRLPGDNYQLVDKEKGIYHWEVSKEELLSSLNGVVPEKLILTSDKYPKLEGSPFHDPSYVLTLSQEAADWLVSDEKFHFYGTSWKSSDFKPGSAERPIHNTLFKKAIIMECLDLEKVPAGSYLFVGAPLPIVGASESPVCPMLLEKEDIADVF